MTSVYIYWSVCQVKKQTVPIDSEPQFWIGSMLVMILWLLDLIWTIDLENYEIGSQGLIFFKTTSFWKFDVDIGSKTLNLVSHHILFSYTQFWINSEGLMQNFAFLVKLLVYQLNNATTLAAHGTAKAMTTFSIFEPPTWCLGCC